MRWGIAIFIGGLVATAVAPSAGAVVPEPGDVIVGDSERGKVYFLDLDADKRRLLSADPRMVAPNDSAFSPDGETLYVSDYDAFEGEGGVFRINPKTGKTKVLAKQDGFEQPDGIAVAPTGRIYVTDLDAGSADGALFRVNPNNGVVNSVFSEAGMPSPLGVVVAPDGTPIVSSGDESNIASVDPGDGSLTTIADSDDDLTGVGGIARAGDGTLYIGGTPGLTLESVNPLTAAVDTVANDFPTDDYGLGIDRKGRVLGCSDGDVSRANPATGDVKLLSDEFGYAEGVEVVPR